MKKLLEEINELLEEDNYPKAGKESYYYVEYDEETGDYMVFGDTTGHAYASFVREEDAQEEADEMNKRMENY